MKSVCAIEMYTSEFAIILNRDILLWSSLMSIDQCSVLIRLLQTCDGIIDVYIISVIYSYICTKLFVGYGSDFKTVWYNLVSERLGLIDLRPRHDASKFLMFQRMF